MLIRMLAALAGVAVWLVGGVEEAAWALLRVRLGAELRVAGCSQVCRGDQASSGLMEPSRGRWVLL